MYMYLPWEWYLEKNTTKRTGEKIPAKNFQKPEKDGWHGRPKKLNSKLAVRVAEKRFISHCRSPGDLGFNGARYFQRWYESGLKSGWLVPTLFKKQFVSKVPSSSWEKIKWHYWTNSFQKCITFEISIDTDHYLNRIKEKPYDHINGYK